MNKLNDPESNMSAFIHHFSISLAACLFVAASCQKAMAHGDEQIPSLSVAVGNNIWAYEPRERAPATPVQFTITRSVPPEMQGEEVTVYLEYWGTSDANDYEPVPRQITLPGGVSSYSFELRPRADRLSEGTETVQVRIVPPLPYYDSEDGTRQPYVGAFSSAVAKIVDADGPPNGPVYSIVAEVAEVREPATNRPPVEARFIVSRTDASASGEVRLAYSGTAGAADYQAGETALFFAPGVTNRVVSISVNGDGVPENEFVIARIVPWRTEFETERYLISIGHSAATLKIIDWPTRTSTPIPIQLGRSVFSVQVLGGTTVEQGKNYGSFPAVVRVARTGELRSKLSVKIARSGTAKAGDYSMVQEDTQTVGSVIVFYPGKEAEDLEIWARNDDLIEPDETLSIDLVPSEDYAVAPGSGRATVTIVDEKMPSASMSSLAVVAPSESAELSGEVVEIETTLDDPSGSFEHIEYFDGGERIGVSGIEPHAGLVEQVFRWNAVPNGSHTIKARVLDGRGAVLVSQEVRFNIANELASVPRAPRILGLSRIANDSLRFEIDGEPGLYHMQSSSDLRTWTQRAPVLLQTGQPTGTEVPNSAPYEFFRITGK